MVGNRAWVSSATLNAVESAGLPEAALLPQAVSAQMWKNVENSRTRLCTAGI